MASATNVSRRGSLNVTSQSFVTLSSFAVARHAGGTIVVFGSAWLTTWSVSVPPSRHIPPRPASVQARGRA